MEKPTVALNNYNMKKISLFLSALLILAMTVFTSCEKKEDTSFLTGEWKLESASVLGQKMTVDEIKANPLYYSAVPFIDKATATINTDNTFSVILPQDGTTKDGTWSYKKDIVSFKSGKVKVDATYSEGILSVPYTIETPILPISATGYYKKLK